MWECNIKIMLYAGNRKHWPRYNASSVPHSMWQDQALNTFKTKFMDLVDKSKLQHTPLVRAPKVGIKLWTLVSIEVTSLIRMYTFDFVHLRHLFGFTVVYQHTKCANKEIKSNNFYRVLDPENISKKSQKAF